MCRTTCQQIRKFGIQNNPQSLESIQVVYKWIPGENGTQFHSFQIMKCVDL